MASAAEPCEAFTVCILNLLRACARALVPFVRFAPPQDTARRLVRQRLLQAQVGATAHEVTDEWRPYHLLGRAQSEVPQQRWIDYEIEAHKVAAAFLADESIPDEVFGLHNDWDKSFMELFCSGDMTQKYIVTILAVNPNAVIAVV